MNVRLLRNIKFRMTQPTHGLHQGRVLPAGQYNCPKKHLGNGNFAGLYAVSLEKKFSRHRLKAIRVLDDVKFFPEVLDRHLLQFFRHRSYRVL